MNAVNDAAGLSGKKPVHKHQLYQAQIFAGGVFGFSAAFFLIVLHVYSGVTFLSMLCLVLYLLIACFISFSAANFARYLVLMHQLLPKRLGRLLAYQIGCWRYAEEDLLDAGWRRVRTRLMSGECLIGLHADPNGEFRLRRGQMLLLYGCGAGVNFAGSLLFGLLAIPDGALRVMALCFCAVFLLSGIARLLPLFDGFSPSDGAIFWAALCKNPQLRRMVLLRGLSDQRRAGIPLHRADHTLFDDTELVL